MSDLTLALEKLDSAIDRLDTALSGYEKSSKTGQSDLFAELKQVKDKNKKLAGGLDTAIGKIEKLLEA